MENSFNQKPENNSTPLNEQQTKLDAKANNENGSENSYRERTTTVKETKITGSTRPRSSTSQIIIATCTFITILFAGFEKVIKPMFLSKPEQVVQAAVIPPQNQLQMQDAKSVAIPTDVETVAVKPEIKATAGNLEAKLVSCRNNGKFVLLNCIVTNTGEEENVTFFSEGRIVDASGKNANTVFVQPDGSNAFNLSDTSEKQIEMPNNVPINIRLMYNITSKEQDFSYASFKTSIGKIEFRNIQAEN